MMIGQDLGIENKYDMMSEDYVDDVMNYLYEQTDKKEEADAGCLYECILEGLREEGRLIEEEE